MFVYDRENPRHRLLDCSRGYLLGEYILAPMMYAYAHTIPAEKREAIDPVEDPLEGQLLLQTLTESVKTKGFSLSTEMALQCNIDGFKKMVEGEVPEFVN
eukprot:CFRG8443T1